MTSFRLPTTHAAPAWLPGVALGLAGAAAVLGFGGPSPAAIACAALLGLGGAGCAWQQARTRRGGDDAAFADYLQGQQQFCDRLVPVWTAQIDSSRQQMDTAVSSLSERFSTIVQRLDTAVDTAGRATASVDDRSKGLVAVFEHSERELGAVVASQRNALAGMSAMLGQVQGLSRFTTELHDMAVEVRKIATQCNLLSLNAAIEAAHAGERGRGFAIVAKEFRELSNQSGETGRRIASLVDVIGEAIRTTCDAAEASVEEEQGSTQNSAKRIDDVLGEFRNVTQALAEASQLLKDESVSIKGEVAEALVQLQFQDRINQILSHVVENLQHLGPYVADHREKCLQAGALQPLDADPLLAELKKTYAMTDEHAAHEGRAAAAPKADSDITFF